MNGKAVSGTMLALLLLGMLTFAFSIQPVRASETIYIRADGSIDPPTAPIEQDRDLYTLTNDIFSDADGIVIERNNMTLDGGEHVLQGSGAWFSTGVSLSGGSNVTVKGFTITGFTEGIRLNTASDNNIYGNNVTNHWYGITLECSSTNNSIRGNNITNNKWWGINLYDSSSDNSIVGNNVTNNEEDGISLDMSSTNNSIHGNNMVNNGIGIRLGYSPNNSISENHMTDNNYGIEIEDSSNNSIFRNQITANSLAGIRLVTSSNNMIWENTITVNGGEGIDLTHSSDNIVSGNAVAANDYHGIGVYNSLTNTISENTITANGDCGIWLGISSHNTILGNDVRANDYYGIGLGYSSDNVIFHNNFIKNDQQVMSFDSVSMWDDGYPSGGNYWSDYTGIDANCDGIGDIPFTIDVYNQDRYPLMRRWVEREVGVEVGDWSMYGVDMSWKGVLDPRWELLSQTEWGRVEVTDVSGTVVTFTGTSHFKNGSELTVPGVKWDIAPTGSYGFILYFIGSNLQTGDRLFPTGTSTINETVTRTYCGVPRENNHHNSSGRGLALGYDLYKLDCYWDQSIGILTEESLEMSMEDLSRSLSIHLKMTDTNIWEAPIPTTINELKTKIEEFSFEGDIDNQGIAKSLLAKLDVTQKLIDDGKTDQAKTTSEAFINEVQAQSGKHITPSAAELLIESAEYILSNL